MVKTKEPDDFAKLDLLMREHCQAAGFKLLVDGWTRKTYNVYFEDRERRTLSHLARVESLATTNGEVRFYDERAAAFAQGVAEALESTFKIEASLLREQRPGG